MPAYRSRCTSTNSAPTDSGAVEKSFRNLPHVKIAYAGGLGTYDLLRADRVLFTSDAIDRLSGAAAPAGTAERDRDEEVAE